MGGSQTTALSAPLYSAVNLNNSAGDEDSEWLELGEDEGKEQYDPELLKQLDNWFNPQHPDNSVSAAGSYFSNNNNASRNDVGGGADDANGLGAFQPFIFPADSGGAVAGADDEEDDDDIDNNIRDFFGYDNDGDALAADDDEEKVDDLDAFDFNTDNFEGGSKIFYKNKTKKTNKTKKSNTKKRNKNKTKKRNTKKRNKNKTKKRNTKKRNKNKTKK